MAKLSHIEINVSDYAKSIRFYDSVLQPLGWRRLVCQKSHTTYSDGQMKLVICPTEERFLHLAFHRKRIGLNHIAFFAESKEQVDHLLEHVIKRHEIRCLYENEPRGDSDYYAIYFEDPDRIKIEVVFAPHYCESSHWTNQFDDDFDPYLGSIGV